MAAAARVFLREIERARYAANVDIIAADPACYGHRATGRAEPNVLRITDPSHPPRGWLCEPLPVGAPDSDGLDLAPIGPDLAPTIELIESLASYSGAITSILEAPYPDPALDLTNAYATAHAAQELLNALHRPSGPAAASADPRLGAVAGFVRFLNELRTEAGRVEGLRRLPQPGPGAAALVEALDDHLESWELSREATEAQNISLAEDLVAAATGENSRFSTEQRRTFAEDYYEMVRAAAESGRLHRALKTALQGLREAEQGYRELLSEHPNLTPAQLRRRSEIVRQRLTRCFELATSIITAFRA